MLSRTLSQTSSFLPLLHPFRTSPSSSFSSSSLSLSSPPPPFLTPSPYEFLEVAPHATNPKVLSITFSREVLHNAFNAQMIQEITHAFTTLNTFSPPTTALLNDHPRAVLLTGKGKTFSAGADLNWMKEMVDYSEEENKEDANKLYNMVKSIKDCVIPVVARVNGSSLGGGAGIVAASDIAISLSSAKFGFTEVKLGLIPAVISPFVLAKIGEPAASRYFLTGEVFSAEKAEQISLVHGVEETQEDLDKTIQSILNHICSSSPSAVRASKNLITTLSKEGTQGGEGEIGFVTGEIAKMRVSELGQEGMRAFLEKRKPAWVQKKGE